MSPEKSTEPCDRNGKSLGVTIYEAFSCEFGMVRPKTNEPTKAHLALTVDLRAKVLRSESLLDQLYEGSNPNSYKFTRQDIDRAKRRWIGTQVIYKADKKCYSVVDLHFDHSAATLPVEGLLINNKAISHAEYFKTRKNIVLQYPNVRPMIECLGRRKQTIFLPAELVCGDELDRRVKEMLVRPCLFLLVSWCVCIFLKTTCSHTTPWFFFLLAMMCLWSFVAVNCQLHPRASQ